MVYRRYEGDGVMEWVLIGMLIALGMYLLPFMFGLFVLAIGAVVTVLASIIDFFTKPFRG